MIDYGPNKSNRGHLHQSITSRVTQQALKFLTLSHSYELGYSLTEDTLCNEHTATVSETAFK